ncbi:MAG: class I SAM-dependent methyltransferase [Myxococcota bacterium]
MDPYEIVPYGSRPYAEAHPDRLCVVGRLFGLCPPDPATARVLELGCGAGLHLAPIAARLPGSRCVGVDRNPAAIARARGTAAQLGASNLTFVEADLCAADPPLADATLPDAYDYVIVHGVYSWVPAEVRDAILARCARWLAPTGIAYVSYNTRPGWQLRGMLAEMLQFHAEGFEAPEKKVAQSRALLQFLAEAVPDSEPYGAWLRREARLVAAQPDAWVFHDLLAHENAAVLVSEFVAHARAHGLQYLGDADLPSMLPDRLPPTVRRVLDTLGSDLVRLEQYLDFVVCRNFRRSLLCRPGVEIDRDLAWPRLEGAWLRGPVESLGVDDAGGEVFRTRAGDTLSTTVPSLRAAFEILADADPAPIAFDALVSEASARAGSTTERFDRELIGRNLLLCFARGVLEVLPREIAVARTLAPRPVADPVIRALAVGGEGVPSLLHEHVPIDAIDRSLLPRLDGTRTVAALIDELGRAVDGGALVAPSDRDRVSSFLAEAVPDRLQRYLRAGLLSA